MDSPGSPKSSTIRNSGFWRLGIFIGTLLVVITIVSLTTSNNEPDTSHVTNPATNPVFYPVIPDVEKVCYTDICYDEARSLRNSMDPSVDPCSDFYSFVCGNWIKNKKLTLDEESQFTELEVNIALRLIEILDRLRFEPGLPPSTRKTIDFYNACMDVEYRLHKGDTDLMSDLKRFGGWPLIEEHWSPTRFDWADLMIKLFKTGYISNMLFTVHVDIDVKNTSKSLLTITHPTLGMKKRSYYIKPKLTDVAAYIYLILKRAHLSSETYSDLEEYYDEVEEAFMVESQIAHMMEEIDMDNPETFYNIFSLKQLEDLAPKIPWRKIITGFLPHATPIADEQRIMVTSPSYIKGLNSLIQKIQSKNEWRKLANYMFYRVVLNAASFIQLPQTGLKVLCYQITLQFFPFPLTAQYVNKHTDGATREVLGKLVGDIRNSLKDGIKNAVWLDAKTKSYALWKIEKMKAIIGFDDEIMNQDNLDRYYEDVIITGDYFSNMKRMLAFSLRQGMRGLHEKREGLKWFELDTLLLSANAYYMRQANMIVVPVGVLQDKIFAKEKPNYINYGTLGMVVGHELSHGFDSIGSMYDADGNFRKWWTDETWNLFENKVKCYEQQYDTYYVAGANDYINGTLTLAENIADNGGLKAAYYGYSAAHTRKGSELTLPNLSYNEKQLFWIAFASVWCDKATEESMVFDVKHDVHTLAKFRVIGTLSNMKEFAEDFSCELNTTMNPASKCSLWK